MDSLDSLLTARSENELWQLRLRRSVRLLLAFGDSACNQLEVEAQLRLVERQLLRHLLPEWPPAPASLTQAAHFMQHTQEALLTSAPGVEAILREFSAQQAINPSRWDEQQADQRRLR